MPSGASVTLSMPVLDAAPADYRLADLVYELLDAHGDTMQLAGEIGDTPVWAAHLDYLRDLQRVGRELLARIES